MDLTQNQYDRILQRLRKIENAVNDIFTALESFITLDQVNQLRVLLSQEITDLREQTETLEDRVSSIENEPLV